jgi:pantoate--beta-alanine ligase
LVKIKEKIKAGSLQQLKKEAKENLIKKHFKPDYVEIADAGNLKVLDKWDGDTDLVILAAAFIDDVRLIDNVLVKHKDDSVRNL